MVDRKPSFLQIPHFTLILRDATDTLVYRFIFVFGPAAQAMIHAAVLHSYYMDCDGQEPYLMTLPLGPVQGEEIVTDINRHILQRLNDVGLAAHDQHGEVEWQDEHGEFLDRLINTPEGDSVRDALAEGDDNE